MNKKILIVEDEKDLRDAYRMILNSRGYETSQAYDGKEAIDKLEQFSPDLILLDLRMPNMSGLQLLDEYRQMGEPKAKIIVFSNLDSEKDINQAYKLGADKYILKAWASPTELLKVVEEALST